MLNTVAKPEYFAFRNAEDYKNNLSITPMTYIESEPVVQDTFTVSGNTVHAKATTTRGYFLKFITDLSVGDVIEVECEVRNISGVKAKIIVDEAQSTDLKGGRVTVLMKQSERSGEWETLKVRHVVKNNNYNFAHAIVFGTVDGEVSEYYVRKLRIKVQRQMAGDPYGYTRTTRNDGVITKWEDGTMEIVSKKTFTDVSVASAWGSIFTSDPLNLGDWSTPFVLIPVVSVSAVSSDQSTIMTAIASQPTNISFPSVVLARGSATASPIPTVTIHVTARGRWK